MLRKPTPWLYDDEVARRANEIYTNYRLAEATTPELMLDRVIQAGGKSITIHHSDNPALERTTALWIEYTDHSKILLRAGDRPYYQTRALHHEFAHILFQHPVCTGSGIDEFSPPSGGKVHGRVLITPDSISPSNGLHRYEGEAEYLAGLITRTLLRPSYLDDERLFG